jgi:hypothetical protein
MDGRTDDRQTDRQRQTQIEIDAIAQFLLIFLTRGKDFKSVEGKLPFWAVGISSVIHPVSVALCGQYSYLLCSKGLSKRFE